MLTGRYDSPLEIFLETWVFNTSLYDFFQSPVTAMTWGHNDKRIFIATGNVRRKLMKCTQFFDML